MPTLLLDADDTLWENIRVFHRTNDRFANWLHPEAPDELLAFTDEIQQEFVGIHGYGAATFRLALLETIDRHRGHPHTDVDIAFVDELVEPFRWERVELRPDVDATLDELGGRNELILVTKGDEAEQRQKISVSGLEHHFSAVHILPNKVPAAYAAIVEEHQLDPETTWMIGNSPPSDIVPALEVGLGAVHIPHPDTWGHEDGELPTHDRLLQLTEFRELVQHF